MSFPIIFTASPSAAHPKMLELCNHTAQAPSHHACTEDGNLKRPHPPIIDRDNWVDWLLVVGCWLLVVGCWLLVVGCWLLVVGCWLLVVGCWLLVVGT